MTTEPGGKPPRLAQRLLRTCVPSGLVGDSLLGDLHEEFVRKSRDHRQISASVWYWRQSIGLGARYLLERMVHPRQYGQVLSHRRDYPIRYPFKTGCGSLMDSLVSDIRHAVRALKRRPIPTGAAIVTLGIGLGAVTAISGVVNGVLLRPLPYDDPQALFFLQERNDQDPELSVSYPNYVDWREQNGTFQHLAAFIDTEWTMTGLGDPVQLEGWVVSASLFPLLGAEPAIGRTFLEEEDRIDGDPVALLSHGLWLERFGGDAGVLGRSVDLAGQSWTVVGVMPRDFSFPPPSPRFDFSKSAFWVPIGPVSGHWSQHRDLHPGITVLGRLNPNVNADQARADMDLLALALEEAYPETNAGQRVSVRAVSDVIIEDVRAPIWTLLGAAGFLLLIACVNVANLQLARATDRMRELAVRSSLGASRNHLVRYVLTETVILSLVGGGVGFALAYGATGLYGFAAHALGSRIDQIDLSLGVLAFSLGLTILTGILSGLIPAWSAGSIRPAWMLRGRGSGGTGTLHRRIHSTLMTAEVAFALMLLVGAGLMIRSFSSLVRAETGLASENLLSMHLSLSSRGGYSDASRRTEFFHQVIERGRSLPGVSSVGAIYPQPLGMSRNAVPYEVEGEPPPPPGEYLMAEYSYVSSDYFRTVGAPLLGGRAFEAQDASQKRPVVIVDETFAERHWPGENAVGKRIKTAGWQTDVPWLEIVGVVSHIKIFGVAGESWVHMYIPFESVHPRNMAIMIRASVGPADLTTDLRGMVRDLDSDVPVTSIRTMESYLADTTAPQRLWALILGILSGVSLLLAGTGVYGVVSYSVSRRDREIGIRVALGATLEGILGQVLREGLTLTLLGLAIGTALALALSRLMSGLLFGVGTSDPTTYLMGCIILLGVSLAACGLPALRAGRIDPVVVLREE